MTRARTLLGEVAQQLCRQAEAMNPRIEPYGLRLLAPNLVPAPDRSQSHGRMAIGGKRIGRGGPVLLLTVAPDKLELGEIVATVDAYQRRIGTRHPAELRAGRERALAELAHAGLMGSVKAVDRP